MEIAEYGKCPDRLNTYETEGYELMGHEGPLMAVVRLWVLSFECRLTGKQSLI
jgi:hypothetical protein